MNRSIEKNDLKPEIHEKLAISRVSVVLYIQMDWLNVLFERFK